MYLLQQLEEYIVFIHLKKILDLGLLYNDSSAERRGLYSSQIIIAAYKKGSRERGSYVNRKTIDDQ